jgi:hypothetical protein
MQVQRGHERGIIMGGQFLTLGKVNYFKCLIGV